MNIYGNYTWSKCLVGIEQGLDVIMCDTTPSQLLYQCYFISDDTRWHLDEGNIAENILNVTHRENVWKLHIWK